MNELGKVIAKARKAQDLSLRRVAAKVGLSYQAVVNAERGMARPENAAKIAKALGVTRAKTIAAAKQDLQRLIRAG